jgi:hypothetical protein
VDDGDGDFSIAMGWDIGTLAPGESAVINFEYRIAGDDVPTPDGGQTIMMLGGALGVLAFAKRRLARRK